ncbi:hypothetical protein [Mucilaginibacter paludis]|uniref:hypothetical protein n=1 Tax=Mucilaginibacter paludis TaxID=423351 RepID=UPI00030D37DF|nr:hypothetical protein [Mucilaginibacter paludis]
MDSYKKQIGLYKCTCAVVAILLCCVALLAKAQNQDFVLKGVVLKSGSNQRISKVLVANLNNGAIVTTDDLGIFQIKCVKGDSLLFRQKDFADQKIGIITENTLMVYMQSVINLNQVDIKGVTKKQEMQEVMKQYNSQGIYNNGKATVGSVVSSPLNGLYDLLGGGPKHARRFQRYSSSELENAEVDKRFNKSIVGKITGLKDEELTKFVESYKPSYPDLKGWNDYDLINYIKKSFKDYQDNGLRPGLQKLN